MSTITARVTSLVRTFVIQQSNGVRAAPVSGCKGSLAALQQKQEFCSVQIS